MIPIRCVWIDEMVSVILHFSSIFVSKLIFTLLISTFTVTIKTLSEINLNLKSYNPQEHKKNSRLKTKDEARMSTDHWPEFKFSSFQWRFALVIPDVRDSECNNLVHMLRSLLNSNFSTPVPRFYILTDNVEIPDPKIKK